MRSEVDKAWLAGFIDGEGSIGIEFHGGKHAPSLRVTVTNTNVALMEEVAIEWNAHCATRRERRAGWKTACDVKWTGGRAADLLREIQPYLRLKSEQCRLGLEFATTVQLAPHHSRRLTDAVRAKRLEIADAIHHLNRRGTAIPAS